MDLAYYSYLARTIPPREIARALAVRAKRAVLERLGRQEHAWPRAPAQERPVAVACGAPDDALLQEAEEIGRAHV